MDIAVELSKTLITEDSDQQLVFLKECDGDRSFPIVIGISEALAIDRRLKDIPTPRPMTHDLMANLLASLDCNVEKIVINDLHDHTFFAAIHLRTSKGVIEVDARPSDALALAVGLNTPLYVADSVFESVSNSRGSRSERLEILRKRLEMINCEIVAIEEMLTDEDFLNTCLPQTISEYRKQLHEMAKERNIIMELLEKYG